MLPQNIQNSRWYNRRKALDAVPKRMSEAKTMLCRQVLCQPEQVLPRHIIAELDDVLVRNGLVLRVVSECRIRNELQE